MKDDARYNLWLSSDMCRTVKTLGYTSMLSKVIDYQIPSIKYPEKEPKSSARVLTSEENRKKILDKEKEKNEKAALNEERKQQILLLQAQKREEKIKCQEKLKEEREKRKLEQEQKHVIPSTCYASIYNYI